MSFLTRSLLVLALLSLIGGSAIASSLDKAGIISAEVTHDGGVYHVTSSARFTAPLPSVYAVLTDYEHLTRISDIVVESRILEEPTADGAPRLHTTLRGCVLFFCRNVVRVERISVVPGEEIRAQVEPELSDLREGFTEWRFFSTEGGGTRVDLQMRVVPDFWIPPLVGPRAMRRRLLQDGAEAVARIEVLAREHAALALPDSMRVESRR